MATELAKAYVQIVPSAQGITGSIQSVLGGEGSAAGEKAGENAASAFGKKFKGLLVGLGIGKLIMDSIGNASEFETGMAKVNTLFKGTGEEFAALQGQVLDLSSAYGLSATTLAEAAYSAESAGVAMEDLGSMLDTSAKLATAGFTDVDTALSATAKTMNAYGLQGEESMDKVAKVLMQTQNLGITTVGELGASLAQVTPTAAAMGVEFEQVGAAMAQLTAAGVPTAQATTQLRSAMTELGKAGTKADKAFRQATKGTEYAGMSFQQAMAAGADLGDVFGLMQAYADKTGKSMVDLWGSVEAGNAAMLIASDVDTFNENLEQMGTDADVVGEAYGKMANTFGNSMNRLKESAKNFVTTLFQGGDISSSFDSMLDSLGDVGEKLIGWITTGLRTLAENLPELTKKLIDFGGSMLEALGDVDWIDLGTTIINGLIGACGELGNSLINLFTDAVGSIADGSVDFASIGTAIWNGITSILGTAGDVLLTLFESAKKAVEGIDFNGIGDAIFGGITSVIDAAGNFLGDLFDKGLESAEGKDWPSVGEVIKTGVNLALNGGKFLSAAFEAGAELIEAIDWKNVGAHAEELIVAGLDGAATLVSTISTAASDLITGVDWKDIGESAGKLITAGLDATANVVTVIGDSAGRLLGGVEWEKLGKDAGDLISAGLGGAANYLQTGFESAVTFLQGVDWEGLGATISGALGDVFGGLGDFIGGALTGAGDVLEGAGELGGKALKGLGDLLFGDQNDLAAQIEQSIKDMNTALDAGKTTLETTATSIGKGIKTSLENEINGDKMKNIGEAVVESIDSGITGKMATFSATILTLAKGVGTTLGMKASEYKTAGEDIVQGIIDGVNAKASALSETLKKLAEDALKAAKDTLGIHSPSRMMREQVGRWIPAGIAEGIARYGALVDDAMDGLANGMASGRVQVALEGGTGMRGISSGYDQMTAGFAGFDSMMEDNLETQNALLREQNGLLARILERTGGGQGVSAGLGRTVSQSLEMYGMIGG